MPLGHTKVSPVRASPNEGSRKKAAQTQPSSNGQTCPDVPGRAVAGGAGTAVPAARILSACQRSWPCGTALPHGTRIPGNAGNRRHWAKRGPPGPIRQEGWPINFAQPSPPMRGAVAARAGLMRAGGCVRGVARGGSVRGAAQAAARGMQRRTAEAAALEPRSQTAGGRGAAMMLPSG